MHKIDKLVNVSSALVMSLSLVACGGVGSTSNDKSSVSKSLNVVSSAKPAATSAKPAATSAKPVATSAKPAATSAKPAATSAKPEIITTKVTFHGTVYGMVKSPYTGKIWLDRNLGAAEVCTSFNDTACYGDYYQWGRNADGHENILSDVTTILASDIADVGHGKFITNGVIQPYDWAFKDSNGKIRASNWSKKDGTSICPVGFRVPTIKELKAELMDVGSARIENNIDAFNSFLKLPTAGYRHLAQATLDDESEWGRLWSVSLQGSNAISLNFYSAGVGTYGYGHADGFTVRCLKD